LKLPGCTKLISLKAFSKIDCLYPSKHVVKEKAASSRRKFEAKGMIDMDGYMIGKYYC
jgi:hypothetical protein